MFCWYQVHCHEFCECYQHVFCSTHNRIVSPTTYTIYSMLLNQFYYTNPLFSNCPSFFVSYLHLHFISYKKLPNFLSNVILLTYLLIYLLTYLLTPWCRVLLEKLTGLQLVKKTPRISRNPKVHYRTHKRRPPVSILGQPNSVHIHTSNLLEIRSNIIRPSTPRSPQWSPSLRFPHQDPIHLPLLITLNNKVIVLTFII